jgi:hypothetical protein
MEMMMITTCGPEKFGNFASAEYIEQNNGEEEEFKQLILAWQYIDENDSQQEFVRKKSAKLLHQLPSKINTCKKMYYYL